MIAEAEKRGEMWGRMLTVTAKKDGDGINE
jgi:hypothetical protein